MAARRRKKAKKRATKRKATRRKKTTRKRKSTRRKTTRKATRRKTTKRRKKTTRRKAKKKTTKRKKATKKKATKKKATKKKATKRKAKRKKSKRKPNPAFMKAVQPDASLAEVVGSSPLPRTQITKKLWQYIKRNDLQDSLNRRMINADDKRRPVYHGKGQVSMFEMTKLVSHHVK